MFMLITSLSQTDSAPAQSLCSLVAASVAGDDIIMDVFTDTSPNIRIRSNVTSASISAQVQVIGFEHPRGEW